MTDKRRDSGEYYPGGRVIARPGTAPQQVVVQWSDVQNKPQVAPLPDRYREDDMKGKINEIASKFATVAVAALIGWTAFAGVTVHKARMGSLWNDEQIVTNVTYSAEAETDPTVPAWAKEETPPQTMTTNAVRDIASEVVAPVEVKVNTALAEAGNKLPKVLTRTDKLSAENPDPLGVPIPLIEYKVLDLIHATKGWMWNFYTDFGYIWNKPTTLSGYGITDAATKEEVDALDAKGVGALPDNREQLEENGNFSGAVAAVSPVQSVNGQVGEVDIRAEDIPYDGLHDLKTVKAALDKHMGQLDSLWPALDGKADKTIPSANGNLAALTADGNLADSGIAKDSVVTIDEGGGVNADAFSSSAVLTDSIYTQEAGTPWIDVKGGALSPDAPSAKWYYLGTTDDREIAVKGDISAENSAFSNAVLAVTTNTIRREVSSALNTYVDGETGVEYEGKFYSGSLYYVPTGNVYPSNN